MYFHLFISIRKLSGKQVTCFRRSFPSQYMEIKKHLNFNLTKFFAHTMIFIGSFPMLMENERENSQLTNENALSLLFKM